MNWADPPLTRGIVIAVVVLAAAAAVLVVRRIASPRALKENNDFVGFAYAFVGVVYGVYLAFMAVIAFVKVVRMMDAER